MSVPDTFPQKNPHPARHVFSIAGIALFSAFIVASFFLAAVYVRTVVQNNQLAAVVTATLVDLANSDRESEDLDALTINPVLVAAAQAKANHMAANSYFAHVSPDGLNSWHWFREAGYLFSYAGENLAVNFSDSEDVERAWMNSPTHRANIMNGKFTEVGIATAVGEYKGKKTIFVAQMFGTPVRAGATPSAPVALVEPKDPAEIAIATTEPEAIVEQLPAPEENEAAVIVVEEPASGQVEAESATGIGNPAPRYGDVLGFFASSPQNVLQAIYIVCALIILVALLLATEFEFKRHHTRHVAAAVFLLALMSGLFLLADRMVFSTPIIG